MGKGFGVAFVCLLTFSAIGEEPLPVVIARAEPREVITEVGPAHETAPITIADAARGNDFITFTALYSAHPDPVFADLRELWTYSQTERFGAFYGEELHARLARRYPGYAAYIDDYRIVDSRGQVFWPSAETRTFLLERALRSEVPEPEVRVAEARPSPGLRPPSPRRAGRGAGGAQVPPIATAATVVQLPKPAPVAHQQPIAAAAVLVPRADNSAASGRGIFLMILGLVGVGVLTLMLRTPLEEQPAEERKMITTLGLTSLPPPTEQQPQPRKTGSHG
ncbi:MAG TPA: hypothetical protein VJ276_07705 [Thermoanaerobaculia bacterium]|nr:hypothetical protein [Thermoanaerobaculia bacterium]